MSNAKGFTLIEIVMVIAILGILAAVAIPAYQDSINKTRRADAKIAMEKAAAFQEQHYFQFNQYSDEIDDVGGNAGSLSSPEGDYAITVSFSDPANPRDGYIVAATAISTGAKRDEDCYSFTLASTGEKKAYKLDGTENSECLR